MKKAAMVGSAASAATALTIGLAAPSATAAAIPFQAAAAHTASAEVDLAALSTALVELLEAYAQGTPPTQFPEEIKALVPGLEQLGPQLLAALGSDDNVAFLRSLDFSGALAGLGLNIPSLDSLLPIPTSFEFGGQEIPLPLKVITTGEPFGALAMLGLNPYWAPAFPGTIAEAINSTPYGNINTEISAPVSHTIDNPLYQPAYDLAYSMATWPTWAGGGGCASSNTACRTAFALNAVRNISPTVTLNATATVPVDLENLRIPVVVAFGTGALSAGSAYSQLVADLPNQPGGTGEGAEAGSSLTILPMILLRNPGRANGGLAARFASFFDLVGLDTVTPDGQVEQDGGAVLVPIKLDATVEYDPMSDFPAWPNPFSLANSLAAFAFPTYILRGTDLNFEDLAGTLGPVLDPVLNAVLGNVLSAAIGDGITVDVDFEGLSVPITLSRATLLDLAGGLLPDGIEIPAEGYAALNRYLTFRSNALPLLEPLRLPVDFLNLATGQNFSNPFADALEPALRILTNLGYTDVDQSNGYERTLTDAGTGANSGGVPFGTLPTNVDWSRVPADVLSALVTGIQQEFFNGAIPGVNAPSDPQANPIAALMRLLGLATAPAPAPEPEPEAESDLQAANALPNDAAESFTVSTTSAQQRTQASAVDTQPQPNPTPAADTGASEAQTPTPKKRPELNKKKETLTLVDDEKSSDADEESTDAADDPVTAPADPAGQGAGDQGDDNDSKDDTGDSQSSGAAA
ncbi:hypothetical protein BHQ18_05555 [Mycolicibacterium flavescens]|uniref:Uncharacterized protein n=2 Tax=Mycolicibacterium flavescens TaxID=1776 RepID=A0A1E3RNU9_MYCFV|nr:hypothetical protein BHQ18_05555 [Mycolicibacterium flavescens]